MTVLRWNDAALDGRKTHPRVGTVATSLELGAAENNDRVGDVIDDGSASGGAAATSVLSWDRNATQVITEICILTELIKSVVYVAQNDIRIG